MITEPEIKKAVSSLDAIIGLCGEFDHEDIPVTGWQMACLLECVKDKLSATSGNELANKEG